MPSRTRSRRAGGTYSILNAMRQAAGTASKQGLIVLYAATIFLSALLLFQVQPIISRFILPWFGGTPAVWTTAMLFFQALLFAGYAYAHLSVQYLRPLWQIILHLALLAGAIAALPLVPSDSWKPADGSDPVLRILILLTVTVGLPYFVLSAMGPLVQAWFSRTVPGRSPYRLFALSNLGSLLALVSYPFLIEPRLTLGIQAEIWRWAFWLFAVLCAVATAIGFGIGSAIIAPDMPASAPMDVRDERRRRRKSDTRTDARPTWIRRLLWLALPALASTAYLAATSFACQDTPIVPFLCITPLALYLLSFVICFDHERWYWPRATAASLLLIMLVAAVYSHVVASRPASDRIELDVGLSFAGLFALCMLCHGELARLKPEPRHLTSFYLMIAAGGVLGGLFVGVVAPLIFSGYHERYLALWGGLVLALAILMGTGERGLFKQYAAGFLPATALLAMTVIAAARLSTATTAEGVRPVDVRRNFYGVLTVKEYATGTDDVARLLYNGHILHGLQFTQSLERRLPTAYYGWNSGVGRVMRFYQAKNSAELRVGTIGLGTGTIAAYARPNDRFLFYEINPEVVAVSREYFSFLGDAEKRMAKHGQRPEVVMGDARLSLERDLASPSGPAQFDAIVLDAFTGDAIPTHFLTREAADIYRRHLGPEGTIAIHVTNRYLNLTPVAQGLADYLKLGFVEVQTPRDPERGEEAADWAILTSSSELRTTLEQAATKSTPIRAVPSESNSATAADYLGPQVPLKEKSNRPPLLWTDDFSDLFSVLR